MPRVRLLASFDVNGARCERGAVLDMEGATATQLAKAGWVEIVRSEQPDTPESSIIERARRAAWPAS